jgi:hypothetical protein
VARAGVCAAAVFDPRAKVAMAALIPESIERREAVSYVMVVSSAC